MKSFIPHNQPTLSKDDFKNVAAVIQSRWLAEGQQVNKLESAVSRLLHQKHAKAVSSGTAALHLSLLALGVRKGDEVILSTYVCTAILNAVNYVGAAPRLVDIDEQNLGPCPSSVRKAISKKTKAIVVNHAYGFSASIEKIKSFGIPVIEDCAQALGSRVNQLPLGSFGDISICSFYATKMMTTGYGGMVLTNHKKYAQIIRDLTHFDQRRDYKVRFNYSLSEISAALGLSQLKNLPLWIRKRQHIASAYAAALTRNQFYYWGGKNNEQPNFYRFVLGNTKPFEKHLSVLRKAGIGAISPLQPYQLLHRYLKLSPRAYPVAEAISRSIFSVPIYPSMSASAVMRVTDALKSLPD